MKAAIIKEEDRIDKILHRVKSDSRRITVRSGEKETHAAITTIDHRTLQLSPNGVFVPESTQLTISFMIGGDSYVGHVTILSSAGGYLIVDKPDSLENRVVRRTARIFVQGKLFSRFHIIPEENEHKEVNVATAPPRLAPIFFELQRDVPDIRKILLMIGNELKTICPNTEIKLHKDGEPLAEEVQLVRRFKKPFWISDTTNAKDLIKDIVSNDIFNYSLLFKEMKSAGADDQKIGAEILARQKRYTDTGIASIIVVPVRMFESVIGHISLVSLMPVVRNFRISDVYYVMALADIVSEALAKARLFKLDTGAAFDIPVINIGSGGVYLAVNSQYIIKFLNVRMKLGLDLHIMNRVIETVSEIRRIDFSGDAANVALRFVQVKPDDQIIIEQYIRNYLDYVRTSRPKYSQSTPDFDE